jgi:hypothetical protein
MKLSGFVFAVLLTGFAQAQPEQLMLNLSASGEVSAEPAIVQVACTIVSGRVPIAILAEAETPGTDTALVIIDVTRGEPVVVDDNDDFTSRSADDLDLLARVLRLPNQGSDALAIGIADDQAICAIAGEVSGTGGSGLINLQINDLSSIASIYTHANDPEQDIDDMLSLSLSLLKTYAPAERSKRSLSDFTLSDELIEKMLAAAAGQQAER